MGKVKEWLLGLEEFSEPINHALYLLRANWFSNYLINERQCLEIEQIIMNCTNENEVLELCDLLSHKTHTPVQHLTNSRNNNLVIDVLKIVSTEMLARDIKIHNSKKLYSSIDEASKQESERMSRYRKSCFEALQRFRAIRDISSYAAGHIREKIYKTRDILTLFTFLYYISPNEEVERVINLCGPNLETARFIEYVLSKKDYSMEDKHNYKSKK